MRYSVRIAITVFCIIAFAGIASAQGACSTQGIRGTYAASYLGYLGLMPTTILGTVTISDDGTFSAKVAWTNPPSMPGSQDLTASGTVAVSADCTMDVEWQQGLHFKEKAVILRNGDEIRSTEVDQGLPAVSSGIWNRMSAGANQAGNCSANTVRGTYAQYCTGWINVGPAIYLPSTNIATATFSADGTFEGDATFVWGGNVIATAYEGATFTVQPDCLVSASFTVKGVPGAWDERAVVFDQGKQMISTTFSKTAGPAVVNLCRFTRLER